MQMMFKPFRVCLPAVLAVSLAACDPLLSIQGSFWPPWIVCIVAGLALTGLVSALLAWLGLDVHLGHPLLVYPSLWALLTFSVWLLAYAR